MLPFLRSLDPRRHLAAAVGWCVFAVVGAAALAAASGAAAEAAARVRADQQRLLGQQAAQVGQALAMQLQTRLAIMQATGAQIVAGGQRTPDGVRAHLLALQSQFPEFTTLVLADTRGRVVAATGGVAEGDDLGPMPSPQGPSLGEMHQRGRGSDPGLVDATVPVLQGPAGPAVGVLTAQLSWPWIDSLRQRLAHLLDAPHASALTTEVMLLDGGGRVLAGGGALQGRRAGEADLAEGGRWLVGLLPARSATAPSLGWTVAVRQDAGVALAPARAAARAVFLGVLAAGVLAAAAAAAVTRVVLRRLEHLAADAQDLSSGTRQTLDAPSGHDEVARIGGALATAVEHLQREKQTLQTLNAELDARVAERTARVEQLAEESRQAAVTRERLRLARELHDTLAHSLMALLTQIRLVRKLGPRLDAQALDDELARAEEAASSGMAEARAAITQMRHNSVRDAGLGAALQELLARFGQRTGIATTFEPDPRAAQLADARAETLFRIVEEALVNVERHAQAQRVTLALRWPGGDGVTLAVADDGVGFDTSAPRTGHFGISGIEEQAALIGATFTLASAPGRGTRLELALPG